MRDAGRDGDAALESAIALLASERGLDFRDYRRETLRNRLEHRVELTRSSDPAAYVRLLESEPREVDRLVDAFLISVTSFYRDPEVFSALRRRIVPAIVAAPPRPATARAWCVGVSTGEEAYSVAMLLADACAQRAGATFEVLASDLDRAALATARLGRYAPTSAEGVPDRARGRWLVAADEHLEVAPELRERVTFAHHDFLGSRLAPPEAVVAEFDLVLLRNVLIYVDERQRRLGIERVAGTLRQGGYLVLGTSEDVPEGMKSAGGPFEVVDPQLRIYRRREERPWR